jgi:hypothetical protein
MRAVWWVLACAACAVLVSERVPYAYAQGEEEDVEVELDELESEEVGGGASGGAGEAPQLPPEVLQLLQKRVVELLLERVSDECRSDLESIVRGEEGFKPSDECDQELRPLVGAAQREVVEAYREGRLRPEGESGEGAPQGQAAAQTGPAPSAFGAAHSAILAVVATLVAVFGFFLYSENAKRAKFREEHADALREEEEKSKKRQERKEKRARKLGRNPNPQDGEEEDESPRVRKERHVGAHPSKKKLRKLQAARGGADDSTASDNDSSA